MDNPSGIMPVGGHIVVSIEVGETEKRLGAVGLVMPSDSKDRDRLAMQTGQILAVAEDAHFGLSASIGKRALFGRYAGVTTQGADGDDYRLLRDDDVKGILHG